MTPNAGCWKRRLVALVIAISCLSGCATVGSETRLNACPPVVEYSLAEQKRAAGELASLPDGAILEGWLADYAVLRDQARACR